MVAVCGLGIYLAHTTKQMITFYLFRVECRQCGSVGWMQPVRLMPTSVEVIVWLNNRSSAMFLVSFE